MAENCRWCHIIIIRIEHKVPLVRSLVRSCILDYIVAQENRIRYDNVDDGDRNKNTNEEKKIRQPEEDTIGKAIESEQGHTNTRTRELCPSPDVFLYEIDTERRKDCADKWSIFSNFFAQPPSFLLTRSIVDTALRRCKYETIQTSI